MNTIILPIYINKPYHVEPKQICKMYGMHYKAAFNHDTLTLVYDIDLNDRAEETRIWHEVFNILMISDGKIKRVFRNDKNRHCIELSIYNAKQDNEKEQE